MDFDRARKHLQLFNVRDLIIRSTRAKQEIRAASGYRLQQTIGDYELWQLEGSDGRYVVALGNEPVLLLTDTWKRDAFQWFTNPALLDTTLVFERPGYVVQDSPFTVVARESSAIREVPLADADCMIEERIGNQAIDITTDCIGRPLLIKMSYHPNWHVSGAARIYRASPSFMLIYPEQRHVRLSYGPGKWDRVGQALTLFALLVLLLNVPMGATATTLWQRLPVRPEFGSSLLAAIRLDPAHAVRWRIVTVTVVTGLLLVGLGAWQVYQSDVHRTFNKSVRLKDQQQYEKARQGFRYAMDELPSSNLAQDSAYYVAMTWYQEKDCERALQSFDTLIRRYPRGCRVRSSRVSSRCSYCENNIRTRVGRSTRVNGCGSTTSSKELI
jgi:tetratricopeptide (TPR) repeat protein